MTYRLIENRSQEKGTEVRLLCRLLGVSPSAYYHWKAHPVSQHQQQDEELLKRIRTIHENSRSLYGSPRILDALRDEGIHCSRKRVARLMHSDHIRAKTARHFKVTPRQGEEALPPREHCVDLVKRCFQPEELNRIWTSDITYIWTRREGWVYLAVVLDLASRRVVGWDLGARPSAQLVKGALLRAFEMRITTASTNSRSSQANEGLILHSDRGSQYTSCELRSLACEHGLRQSYGFSCFDNAVTESFFHTLKTEHIQFTVFDTRAEARSSLFDYIEIFYNRQRKHSALDMKSPVQFEEQNFIS